ncbi:MAG: TetR family transcriptional regulator [Blautia sp.]|nr:TetR family transcriptional regulator [Blautia sp.]
MRLTEICKAAGATRPTFYYHFPSAAAGMNKMKQEILIYKRHMKIPPKMYYASGTIRHLQKKSRAPIFSILSLLIALAFIAWDLSA